MKMRILHIVGNIDPKTGGVGQGIRMMIAGLTALGTENEVVSLDPPHAHYIKEDKFPFHTPGEGKRPWFYNPNLVTWLSGNLERFDAVIVHGLWLYHGYAARKAIRAFQNNHQSLQQGKTKNPKWFVMPHGMLDPYFQRATGRKIKALRNWLYWKLIEGKIINGADGILFTCEMEKQLACKPFSPYRPKRETVVGLGVEPPPPFISIMQKEFMEKCPALGNGSYFLFLSRIHEKKGVDLLINAYKIIIEKPFQHPVPKLIIAGPGLETPYGQKMQQLAATTTQLKNSILFPGMLSGNIKWGAFYGCDAFVLPSHQENFGIAVVEALACSKPVLISNQVNICGEIAASNGGIVADDTLEGTSSLLERWECLPIEEKQLMGQRARECFEKKFAMVPAAGRVLNALNF